MATKTAPRRDDSGRAARIQKKDVEPAPPPGSNPGSQGGGGGGSVKTWVISGRLCVRVIPRSSSNWLTHFDRIDDPRSACMVNWSRPICSRRHVSPISVSASSALSHGAIIHPTT